MSNTIANVLTGVATLAVRQPNDARAEWSTVEQYAGSRSVKLTKTGSGDAGSTHVELSGSALTDRAITMTAWTAALDTNSFWHKSSAVTANFAQMEFRFEDPDSDAWAEITDVDLQGITGSNTWLDQECADADLSGIGGVDEIGASFFDWGLAALNGQQAAIEVLTSGADCSNWILTRVRVELWETSPARTSYIDSIEIMGTVYTIEPGGTGPAISLSSPFVDLGYTEDGVTLTYNADESDIEVEEETVAIDRVITKESIEITCNMAEGSLANMGFAMAGSVVSGNILTVGGSVNKTMNLRLEGLNPAGYLRQMFFPKATATGSVGMPFKKGEKTVVPVTFQALKPAGEPAFTVVDNAA